ncbi:MAG: hypothetical protein KF858_11615 [Candidatus Sumerlaeia bacterium]|nr:hypothetical protein [Candidatus Sumerlaeia bacterium]
MGMKLLPVRGATACDAEFSSQVYVWPSRLRRMAWSAPWVGLALVALGVWMVRAGMERGGFEEVTAGLLELTLGLSLLVGVVMLHAVAAREVRFTRDSIIVRQTGRGALVLDYADYQQRWVADMQNPAAVRLVVFEPNRGCTILLPELWLVEALREVGRIQEQEGW